MIDLVIDERGEILVEDIDDFLGALPRYTDMAVASALKSEGYRLKDILKRGIQIGEPGGRRWDKLNPHTGVLSRSRVKGQRRDVKNYRMVWRGPKGQKRRVREYKRYMGSTRRNPLSRFAGAVRYRYDAAEQAVAIGFLDDRLSGRMMRLARMHAGGFKTRVTPRMRKFLFALGFPIKKETTVLETPERPAVDPVFRAEKGRILQNVQDKILANVHRYIEEGR